MTTAAVIVAAGRGLRAGGGVPKQWRPLAGRPMAWHAMQSFAAHPAVTGLVVVLNRADIAAGLYPVEPRAELVVGGDDAARRRSGRGSRPWTAGPSGS